MMPRPSVDLEEFRGAMVNYGDAMTMTRALLWELKAPKPGTTVMMNLPVGRGGPGVLVRAFGEGDDVVLGGRLRSQARNYQKVGPLQTQR